MPGGSPSNRGNAPSPPPAPPLPEQSYAARARSALARFAQLSTDVSSSAQGSKTARQTPKDTRASGLSVQKRTRSEQSLFRSLFNLPGSPKVPQEPTADTFIRSPVSTRNTVHKTGIPIASLDISPSRTHAILAGRDILKTIRVSDSTCTEDFNLRAVIVAYASTHDTAGGGISARHRDQLAAQDVKWSHGPFDRKIATAAANGHIVVYDIDRAGVEMARLHEHNRQVHRLGFNPHQGSLMLSGSQDSTIRLWDLRALAGEASVMTCQSIQRFLGNSEGVRDVRWSPTNVFEFAAGTDTGVIQRWDMRKGNAPLLKITAHEMTCNSVDWHPDGKHLVSGGMDQNVKVWDFSSSDRRMKPMWQLRAPKAVMNVRWRPVSWSSRGHRSGNWRCTQLATSYDKMDPRIHLWDFSRPSVPVRVLDRSDTPPSSLLWRSDSLLWSVASTGMFTQTDITCLPEVADHRSPNTVAFAADGRITFTSMKRERPMSSIEDVTQEMLQQDGRRDTKSTRPAGSNNATEASLDDANPLPSSLMKARRGKQPGASRSAASVPSTPPSAHSGEPVEALDASLQGKNLYRLRQVIGTGYIPGVFDADAFTFMARHYKAPPSLPAGRLGYNLTKIFKDVFEHNAKVAAFAGQHKLSQTWSILGLAVQKEFQARSDRNLAARESSPLIEASIPLPASPTVSGNITEAGMDDSQISPLHKTDVKLLSPIIEHESSRRTSSARPGRDDAVKQTTATVLDNIENLHLPHSTFAKVNSTLATSPSDHASGEKAAGGTVRSQTGVQMALSTGTTAPRPKGWPTDKHLPVPIGINTQNPQEGTRRSKLPLIQHPSAKNLESTPKRTESLQPVGLDDFDTPERRAVVGSYRPIPRDPLRYDEPRHMSGAGLDMPNLGRHDSIDSLQLFSASTDSSQRAASVMSVSESNHASEMTSSSPKRSLDVAPRSQTTSGGEIGFIDVDTELEHAERGPTPASSSHRPLDDAEGESSLSVSSSWVSFRPPRGSVNHIVRIRETEPLENNQIPITAPAAAEDDFIEADFFPEPEEIDSPAWAATAMMGPLINYYVERLFDTQFPTWLILHVAPYFRTPMDRDRALAIMYQYQDQLQSLGLYVQAAELRLQAREDYPELAEDARSQVDSGGPWCLNCRKPSKGSKLGFCERCNKPWGKCPICLGQGTISPKHPTGIDTIGAPAVKNPMRADNLWNWCQYCGHGGHRGCMKVFWVDGASEGACPTIGCMCDCMPGSRRDEINERLEAKWKKERGPVHRDDWKVGESGAVRKARTMVSSAEAGKGAGRGILQSGKGAGGGGPLSLGQAGRSASGGKKVRIVLPEEEGDFGR